MKQGVVPFSRKTALGLAPIRRPSASSTSLPSLAAAAASSDADPDLPPRPLPKGIAESVTDLIGNTPMVYLDNVTGASRAASRPSSRSWSRALP